MGLRREETVEQRRHGGGEDRLAGFAALDVAGQREALQVEPEALRFEIELEAGDELDQDFIGVRHDERAAGDEIEGVELGDDGLVDRQRVGLWRHRAFGVHAQ